MNDEAYPERERWARFRFAIVGPLLAAPPAHGELHGALERLAKQTWHHPVSGEPVRFAFSTIERWFHAARSAPVDPISPLRRQVRRDAGEQRSLAAGLREALRTQYRNHPSWSYLLHAQNLAVLAEQERALGSMPSYDTVRRYMKSHAMHRQPRKRSRPHTAGVEQARQRLEHFEVRSFEVEFTNALHHADYHNGSLKVVTRAGDWETPVLFASLDDHSRVACHVQWYLHECGETFAHGTSQAFQKRALPRGYLTDNGGPMTCAEVRHGLHDLGVTHHTTLAYSPHQNAKSEVFWASVEGRLLAMLENDRELTLERLNAATQAWVELEYNRSMHAELATSPLDRYLHSPDVGRDSPDSDALRRAFRTEVKRTLRRSDGTLSLAGQRFEVPSAYRHLSRLHVRYARWDLSRVDLLDPRTGEPLCALYPLDKNANADGRRRRLAPLPDEPATTASSAPPDEIAPLLKKLMADFAATGLPPPYLSTPDPEPES